MQNNGESEPSELPAKPVIKKKRLIWDIQIDPDDADMAGASEEAIKMMTQSRRVSDASNVFSTILTDVLWLLQLLASFLPSYYLRLPFYHRFCTVLGRLAVLQHSTTCASAKHLCMQLIYQNRRR